MTCLESVVNTSDIINQDCSLAAHNIQGTGPDSLPRLKLHHELVHRFLHLHHDAPLRRLLGGQECVRETLGGAPVVECGHGDRGTGLEVS